MNEDRNKRAWYALLVLFAINMMNFFDRQIIESVAPLIIKEFDLSDSDYADVITSVYFDLRRCRRPARTLG